MITCESQSPDFAMRISDGVHEALSDTTADHGGSATGFRPHDLLEAALGSCIGIIVRMFAKRHAIPLESVAVTVTLNRDNPEEALFEYALELRGDLTQGQRAKLHRAAKSCPVHKTLSRAIVIRAKEE